MFVVSTDAFIDVKEKSDIEKIDINTIDIKCDAKNFSFSIFYSLKIKKPKKLSYKELN